MTNSAQCIRVQRCGRAPDGKTVRGTGNRATYRTMIVATAAAPTKRMALMSKIVATWVA
jgi:hypothetical protein